jgi:predicted acylesterase/phospholipase RssA
MQHSIPINYGSSQKKKLFSQTYRCCDLACDKITTLILGGGGVYGFLYLGLIKFLEEQNILQQQVTQIIGVSVGSMMSLYLALGYTYAEIYKSVMFDIELAKILDINSDNIFNILDHLGINNGAYVEETIKNIILAKGLSPYLTFRDLTDAKCGPDLNIGYTRCFHNDFFMANTRTAPDMPIWLAIRASISIPIILTPILDFISNDILCDGGLVNNTPIKWYLANWWSNHPLGHQTCIARTSNKKYHDVATQTLPDDLAQQPQIEYLQEKQIIQIADQLNQYTIQPNKYRQHFWCIDFKTLTYSPITNADDLKSVNLSTYLSWVIHKIFANQDASRDKYTKYICQLDTKDYPEINRERFDLDMPTREIIINRSYEEYKKYYHTTLLTPNVTIVTDT